MTRSLTGLALLALAAPAFAQAAPPQLTEAELVAIAADPERPLPAREKAVGDAMRKALNQLDIAGKVVIGEGERDEAPMLFIGEEVGTGEGPKVDIAIDPLEGTTITAKGMPNALAVLAMAEAGCLLHAPDVYMDKIAAGPGVPAGVLDLDKSPADNVRDLAEVLCPAEWNDSVIAETEAQLAAYGEREGGHALQMAISGGQYSHPDGIFFGGQRDTWSRRTLLEILGRIPASAEQIAIIDYHTGLGPRGYGERICAHLPDSGALTRAEQWYDGDMTCPSLGTSSACELNGVNLQGMERALSELAVTGIALEFGTLPTPLVRRALRADNWLHVHGEPDSPKGRAIKADIREAFYQDADDWKQMIWDRAIETQRLALRGMAES